MRRIKRLWAPLLLCALLWATLVGVSAARPNPAPLASPAKTLTVSASDCYPVTDDINYLNGGSFLRGEGGRASFICPVHLPGRAAYEMLIQGITMYAYDHQSGSDVEDMICAEAFRSNPSTASEKSMGEVCSTGSSTANPRTFTISGGEISPNRLFPTQAMYLWVTMGSTTRLTLYGFHISYDVAASIDIEKYTNGHDADTPPGALVPVPSIVTWSYKVTNTGAVELTNVQVTDSERGLVSCPFTTLAAGASDTCTVMGDAVAGQYGNSATVTADYSGTTVSDTDTSHYWGTTEPILSTYFPLIMRNY